MKKVIILEMQTFTCEDVVDILKQKCSYPDYVLHYKSRLDDKTIFYTLKSKERVIKLLKQMAHEYSENDGELYCKCSHGDATYACYEIGIKDDWYDDPPTTVHVYGTDFTGIIEEVSKYVASLEE